MTALAALAACSPPPTAAVPTRASPAPSAIPSPSPTPPPPAPPAPPAPVPSRLPAAPPPPAPAPAASTPPAVPPPQAVAPAKGVLVVGSAGTVLRAAPGGSPAGRLRGGVVVPIEAVAGEAARVLTPCERRVWVPLAAGQRVTDATVVLDPGHGGSENGALGPGGLAEKDVNLDVARFAADALRAEGVPVVLTREQDYRATLVFRAAVVAALRPSALVSIHHNAEPDGPLEHPGTETYYQYRSPASKRLAGLLQEEARTALTPYAARWVGDRDAGAKWRLNSRGGDYYSILRRPGEMKITAALAELAFVSNPSEEALLARPDVQKTEGQAVARAILRFLRTSDAGSWFTTPYPRDTPAGPGGGTGGCVDPS